ncbi:MAG: OmpA family protein [Bacteroidota bacterium]
MKYAFLLILLLPFSNILLAQSNFQLEDFHLDGSAKQLGEECFQLVPDQERAAGSIWHKKAIDLSEPLDMELKVMMGCKDRAGADGIVLVFSNESVQTGWSGEGMGFMGLYHSLGIEIDTWRNEHLLDPKEDHMAVMANGNTRHRLNLAGPKILPNVEDCRLHSLQVQWSPSKKTLIVTMDGKHSISYTGDIVRTLFRGESEVYWGITAATGKYSNRHEFCIEKLEYTIPKEISLDFDLNMQHQLLEGKTITLEGIEFPSGSNQLTKKSLQEAERLHRFLEANPKHHISINGHTDDRGAAANNEQLSKKRAEAIANYLKQKGIDAERIKFNGYGEKFPIADNDTEAGRKKNRRIDVFVFVPQA